MFTTSFDTAAAAAAATTTTVSSPLLTKPRDEPPLPPPPEEIQLFTDNQTQIPITKFTRMNSLVWHKVAAVSGIAAVGLGAFGAHVFKPQNTVYKEVWQTASLYHLSHSAALLAAPITKHPRFFGGCMTAGIVGFSGTCYLAAYLEDKIFFLSSIWWICISCWVGKLDVLGKIGAREGNSQESSCLPTTVTNPLNSWP